MAADVQSLPMVGEVGRLTPLSMGTKKTLRSKTALGGGVREGNAGGIRDGGGDVWDLRVDDVDDVHPVAGEQLCEQERGTPVWHARKSRQTEYE